MKTLKERINAGEVVYGLFCKTTAPEFIEVAGYAGFDFCILDMEHGPIHFERLQNLVRAAECSGIAPIVRTQGSDESSIAHPLDLAVEGVQVPQVNSLDEAKRIIKAAKFAPLGERGVCRFVRAAKFTGMDRQEYFKKANESLVILQLEGTSLDVYKEIATLEGVDVLFIGPYDLSQALGLPGQIEHPRVREEVTKIIEIAKANKKAVGIFADTPEQAHHWVETGVQYIAYSVDVGIFMNACKETLSKIRK